MKDSATEAVILFKEEEKEEEHEEEEEAELGRSRNGKRKKTR